jgi:hypothetical protein
MQYIRRKDTYTVRSTNYVWFLPTTWLHAPAMTGVSISASAAAVSCPRRTSKRSETVCTAVVEPAVLAALRHVHPMETFPIAVAVAAAAAAPLHLGGSAAPCPMSVAAATGGLRVGGSTGTGTAVPSPPPHPPRAGVLVLFPRRDRRARLPDSVWPLKSASQQVVRQPTMRNKQATDRS